MDKLLKAAVKAAFTAVQRSGGYPKFSHAEESLPKFLLRTPAGTFAEACLKQKPRLELLQ